MKVDIIGSALHIYRKFSKNNFKVKSKEHDGVAPIFSNTDRDWPDQTTELKKGENDFAPETGISSPAHC